MSPLKPCLKFLFCLLPLSAVFMQRSAAQSFSQQFDALFLKERPDSVQLRNLIRLWQRTTPDDPQLYIAAFNYAFSQSRRSESAPRAATDTAPAVYTVYDSARLRNAIAWIDQGILRFPDRLDMRFGKAHVQRLTHGFDSFLVSMKRVLDRSVENKNNWVWTGGVSLDSGRRFMLNTMQSYLREMYESGQDALLPVMSKLGASVLAVYPEEVEILSTTAVSLLLQKKYADALAYLRRAEHIRPKDVVVLNNIAEAYRLLGDTKSAKRYLEAVESNGTAAQKEQARRQKKALKH